MIKVTAVDEGGKPDGWTVTSNDGTIAKGSKVPEAENQIKVEGFKQGETKLVIANSSGKQRFVPVKVYSPMELDIGDLTIRYVDTFEYRWNDKKSGGKYSATFCHPVVPDELKKEGWRALGSIGFKGYYYPRIWPQISPQIRQIGEPSCPNGKHWMIIVKESKKDLKPPALKDPVSYIREYDDSGSGALNSGSFWTPFCEQGYVAMGTVVAKGYGEPLKENTDAVCVRSDLTKPGEVEKEQDPIWTSEKTEGTYQLGAWRIKIPNIPFHERAYLETGTFVGWGNRWPDYSLCKSVDCWKPPTDHLAMHVLSVNLPMLIDTPEETQVPKLTGYAQPPLEMEPVMLKSMLVPFSALLGGNVISTYDTGWLVENSPFVRVDRIVHNKLVFHNINNTSLEQQNQIVLASGVRKGASETMTKTVGISITAEAGVEFKGFGAKTSVTVSHQFGYETTHSIEEFQEKNLSMSINVPSGRAVAFWQQRNIYRVMRHNNGELDRLVDLEFGIDTYASDEYPD